jgi:hypothetical protein
MNRHSASTCNYTMRFVTAAMPFLFLRLIPVRAFALRAHPGVFIGLAGHPFVLAPLTAIAVGYGFNLDLCHMEDSTS